MRYLAALLCVLALLGCNDQTEQRRQHTLTRMDYGGGTAESKRVQQLIVTALEQADTKSLQSPNLVYAKSQHGTQHGDRPLSFLIGGY
jgi:hypothetical protein